MIASAKKELAAVRKGARTSLLLTLAVGMALPGGVMANTQAVKQAENATTRLERMEKRVKASTEAWVATLDATTRSKLQVQALKANSNLLAKLTQLDEKVHARKLSREKATALARTTVIQTYQRAIGKLIKRGKLSPAVARELRAYPQLKYSSQSFDALLDEVADRDEELNTSFPSLAFAAVVLGAGLLTTGVILFFKWLKGDKEQLEEGIFSDPKQAPTAKTANRKAA